MDDRCAATLDGLRCSLSCAPHAAHTAVRNLDEVVSWPNEAGAAEGSLSGSRGIYDLAREMRVAMVGQMTYGAGKE